MEAALVSVMRAVPTLDPAALVPEALPEGRAGSHLSALRDLWREARRAGRRHLTPSRMC